MTGQLALFTTRPRPPRDWFVICWRPRRGQPLWRARVRGFEAAMRRVRQLMRGGRVRMARGGYLSVESDWLSLYCDSSWAYSAREWKE
jgi:hypothetical protein